MTLLASAAVDSVAVSVSVKALNPFPENWEKGYQA
mgnify:CR=1 FL=1